MKLHWWGAPEKIAEKAELKSPVERFEGSNLIKKAGQVTVFLSGVMVLEKYDANRLFGSKDTNDLFVATTYQVGTEPTITTVHYIKENAEIGWHGDFFSNVVLAEDDFTSDHITLRVQVYDLDKYDKYKDFVEKVFKEFDVGLIFPALLPYMAFGSAISDQILRLIDSLDTHDRIIDERVRFAIAEPKTGQKILQTGHFVCFRESIDAEDENLYLDKNLRVVHEDGKRFDGCSYAVYTVTDEVYTDYRWKIDQKIAKLISELNGKGNSGEAAIHFLRKTMEAYTKYRKAERYVELKSKSELTEEEKRLLNRLEREIRSDEVLNHLLSGV
ncbi:MULTISPECIES: hypothetical protein [unclassified Archaeoglobus]|jgi:hypothetical protein|uniref:hypothetical protein n=1 Tax=unclassified Archaeoglobus TaxID=2643606 RepID=UPI0025BA0186|nr:MULTISPECIES: hypothetical protein [unclassified Archaeoglobus]